MAFATIKRGANRTYSVLSEYSSPFFISKELLDKFSLKIDSQLTEEEFYSLKEKVLSFNCRKKALEYLSRREHTTKELKIKLSQKEFPPEIIDKQLEKLEDENLLNNKRFAQQLIYSRQLKNPEGPALLIQRLIAKGVSRTTAAETVTIYFEDEQNLKTSLDKAVQRAKRKKGSLEQELRKKGFSYTHIREYLESDGSS